MDKTEDERWESHKRAITEAVLSAFGPQHAKTDPRFEPSTPFTDDNLNEIERSLARQLPESYRNFVKTYGGAFIGGEVQGPVVTSILGFFDAEEFQGPSSLLKTYEDLTEIGALPIADCEFGNPYVLTSSNEVHYIDYTGGKTTAHKVSNSFEDFISKITVSPEDRES